MIIVVNSQVLAAELRLLNKIAPAKPTIPILAYVLFRAEDGLTLETTDLEVGLRTACTASIVEPGTIALPAAKLLELLEQFPEAEVRIELQQHSRALVSSGAFRSRLQAMVPEDFPVMPSPSGEVSVVALHSLIERTRYAIQPKTTNFSLSGALLKLNSTAAMVATDGKRLALATAPYQGPELTETIPIKTLDLLLNFEGPLQITQGEHHLFFQAGPRLLISRKLEAKFPAWERIVPKDNDKMIVVNRSAFTAALRRVAVVSEVSFAAFIEAADGLMSLTAKSPEVGEALEELPCSYAGPVMKKFCFNWRFVLDFLETSQAQNVTLEVKDENTPMLLTDGSECLNVIMLMRA